MIARNDGTGTVGKIHYIVTSNNVTRADGDVYYREAIVVVDQFAEALSMMAKAVRETERFAAEMIEALKDILIDQGSFFWNPRYQYAHCSAQLSGKWLPHIMNRRLMFSRSGWTRRPKSWG